MIESILQAVMYPFLFLSMYFQVLLLVSFFENKKNIQKEEFQKISHYPSVAVAVPCWNEEKTLPATLDSLLALDYPKDKLSIIVVDDGSKDATLAIAKVYEYNHPGRIRVLTKENGGKHSAVNMALHNSESDLFGCLDADSFVTPHTLKIIASYFEKDEETMAVTPCIHVTKPETLIQRMQAIEYLMGVFLRKAYGQLDAIQVTPGPFSIFRREVFDIIGDYRKAHNTEDFEITLRMHKHHLKIVNSHKALVYTVGPATARGFFFQRLRWARGFMENSIDYKELFFKKKYGNFGVFTLPMAFMFMFYGIYAAVFSYYSFFSQISLYVRKWSTVGLYFKMPSFDIFYFNTTVMSFLIMVLLSMFLLVLYIGNMLSDDKQEFYRNFPLFFLLYPIFVPLFLGRAIVDTILNHKNEWVLQDTKNS
jgi:cellulose synthase/poly-beta-1,6-N-acetylglucosamine synthase-like glycosyltransferase